MKKIIGSVVLMFIIGVIDAQDFLGIANSNYAGLYGLDLQPASIVDSRLSFDLVFPILGLNVEGGSNLLKAPRNGLSNGGDLEDALQLFNNEANKGVMLNVNAMGPSVMWNYKNKYSFALTSNARAIVNIHDVAPDLAVLLNDGLLLGDTTVFDNLTQGIQSGGFGIKILAWQEYGATFGMPIYEVGPHFVKGAITLKYLKGVVGAYVDIDDINFGVGDSTIDITSASIRYGFSDGILDDDISAIMAGGRSGFGLDIGFVYEFRPEKNKAKYLYSMDASNEVIRHDLNKYLFKVGVSLVDMGKVGFNTGSPASSFEISNQSLLQSGLSGDPEQMDSFLLATFSGTPQDPKFSMRLPTAFSLQFDYHIWRGFYVNATAFMAFKQKNLAVSQLSRFSVTPRLENKIAEIAFPMSYAFRRMNMGLSLRFPFPVVPASHFVFGSNNLFNLIGGNSQVSVANVYIGFRFQFNKGLLKDRDGDGFSKQFDKNRKRTDATMSSEISE